jgi:hypothetical protein
MSSLGINTTFTHTCNVLRAVNTPIFWLPISLYVCDPNYVVSNPRSAFAGVRTVLTGSSECVLILAVWVGKKAWRTALMRYPSFLADFTLDHDRACDRVVID